VLWRCDDCGGAAKWTMINGHPHYICNNEECAQWRQLDMWPSSRYIDSVGSVSGLAEAEARATARKETTRLEEELPF